MQHNAGNQENNPYNVIPIMHEMNNKMKATTQDQVISFMSIHDRENNDNDSEKQLQ